MSHPKQLEEKLQRWVEAGLIDAPAAERIRNFEAAPETIAAKPHGLRWPVLLAVALGALMVGAGVLLFVASHWDELSPTQRFSLVLLMVAGFHLTAGALMPRMRSLGIALHGVGTVTLGAGIFLAAQIFNLQEHWPGGILLWAIGAVLGWVVLRDWLQATLAFLLVPGWIASEWGVRADHYAGMERLLVEFLALLSIAYLGARGGAEESSHLRRALVTVGAIALLPAAGMLGVVGHESIWRHPVAMSHAMSAAGILMAFGLPLAVALILRGRAAAWVAGFAVWAFVLGRLDASKFAQNLTIYGLLALGSIGLVLWGLQEHRRERVDLGVAGFALTVIAFYFSTVMDKLGRSASLIAFGLLFLLGGWKLEQLRRKLVQRVEGSRGTGGGA
jgi:uncharacterized membrane protein